MLAVAAVAHAAGPKAATAPDYFPLHEHDIWRYRSTNARGAASNFVVTVAAAQKEKDGSPSFQTQTLVEGKRILDWYAKPQGWVVHLSQFPMGAPRATEFKPTKRALKNPPHVGDKWSWKGTGADGLAIEMEAEVLEETDVTVPAGRFHAFRIVTRTKQRGSDVNRMQWYAAGVGMVRAETEIDGRASATELMEYHVAP